jgi:hypothetical protein
MQEWEVSLKDLKGEKQALHGPDSLETKKKVTARSLTCESFGWVVGVWPSSSFLQGVATADHITTWIAWSSRGCILRYFSDARPP